MCQQNDDDDNHGKAHGKGLVVQVEAIRETANRYYCENVEVEELGRLDDFLEILRET